MFVNWIDYVNYEYMIEVLIFGFVGFCVPDLEWFECDVAVVLFGLEASLFGFEG